MARAGTDAVCADCLRRHCTIPLAVAHAIMDGAGVLIGVLIPLLRG